MVALLIHHIRYLDLPELRIVKNDLRQSFSPLLSLDPASASSF